MMSCAGVGESQPIPPCAWRDTLGPQPNSGSASNSNTTSAPPGKPGYERSRKRSNRGPQPLKAARLHLRAPTGRGATHMDLCARGVIAHISSKAACVAATYGPPLNTKKDGERVCACICLATKSEPCQMRESPEGARLTPLISTHVFGAMAGTSPSAFATSAITGPLVEVREPTK